MRTGTKKLRISAAVALCAAIAAALIASSRSGRAARPSPAADLLDALPSGASTLVYLDLAAVRASSFYQHRPDKGPIAVPNQDYQNFVRSTGFDFEKDLDRVVVGLWPATRNSRKSMAVAEGRFDREKIRAYAETQGRIDHQRGREVFLFPTSAQGSWNSAVFLDEHRLALVSGQSIDPLFEAHSTGTASNPVLERAARFDGAAAFAVSQIPPIPDNPASGPLSSPAGAQLLTLVRSIRWVTFALRPEGDSWRVALEGECDNGESARELQSALELLRAFGRMGLQDPKTRGSMSPEALASLQTVLNSAEVTQTDQRVRVLVELTPDILKAGDNPKQKQH
jgi:hypothetical protein